MKICNFRFIGLFLIGANALLNYSCKHASEKTEINAKDSLGRQIWSQPTVVIHDTAQERADNIYAMHNPLTFETTKVYRDADTTSKVVEVLQPFTPFREIHFTEINRIDTLHGANGEPNQITPTINFWLETTTNAGNKGYIELNKIARFVYNNPELNAKYLIGDCQKGKDHLDYTRFAKLDIATNKVISQIEYPSYSSEYEQCVRQLKNLPLKNVRNAIWLYYHGDFCGGGDGGVIMADTPTGLALIPTSHAFFDDGGGIDATTTYIPAVNHKGELKLYADAETGNNQNKPSVIGFPSSSKIPQNELIVEVNNNGEYLTDKDGETLVDKHHRAVIGHLEKTTTVYHWDGQKVVKVSQTKLKIK